MVLRRSGRSITILIIKISVTLKVCRLYSPAFAKLRQVRLENRRKRMLKKYKHAGIALSGSQMKKISGGTKTNMVNPVMCRYDWDCWPQCNGNNPIGYYCVDNNCTAQTCEPA